MWFTKESDGYRGWLPVARNGILHTGIAASITVTIVDEDDSTSTAPTVSESTQLNGLYTFLIPASFFTTNGTGQYSVVAVVSAVGPVVRDVIGKTLGVFENDFDSLASITTNYLGSVHIDPAHGTAGTVVGVNGTPSNPVTTLADAVTLAAAIGLRRYAVHAPITLTSGHDDWAFIGVREGAAVQLANQDVADSFFQGLELSGICNGRIRAIDCVLDGVTSFLGSGLRCRIKTQLGLATGESTFQAPVSEDPGLSTTPILDVGGAGRTFQFRGYSGGVEVRNFNDAGNVGTIEFIAGQCILDSTCTGAGDLSIRGIARLVDNSSLTNLDTSALLNRENIPDDVWDELLAGHVAVGSAGEALTFTTLIKKMLINRLELADGVASNWVLYDDNDITPLLTFSVTDKDGLTITQPSGAPSRRTRGT